MTDNRTHIALFELQKNLGDLSSAKIQMEEFRSTSINVVQGIENVQEMFYKHLTDLETDFKHRISKLEEGLTSFILENKELNKNTIQELASVSKMEFSKGVDHFNTVANKVETSNNAKILSITSLLEAIEKDYQLKLHQLQEAISSFIISQKEENKITILDVASTSKELIKSGVEQLRIVTDTVEKSNNVNITTINELLEHYKNVVEASRSLIVTLNAIDFPSKLDALSSKTQLVIEAITNAKQALELKSNEAQNSINDKTTAAKDQIIINTDAKFHLLSEQLNNHKEIVSKTITDKFSEQVMQTKASFENLNNSLKENIAHLNQRLGNQEKEIRFLKMITFAILTITILGTVIIILVSKKIL